MKILRASHKMNFGVGWNAVDDGRIIVQVYEENNQGQLVCFKFHLINAVIQLLELIRQREHIRYRKLILEKVIGELREIEQDYK